MIFVFGSNTLGIHGAGAALAARREYGAKSGIGEGRTGNAYAIPTKSSPKVSLPLADIERGVRRFIDYAKKNPDLEFMVTRIGCGLAGYDDPDIAPMFAEAPENCLLPLGWRRAAHRG